MKSKAQIQREARSILAEFADKYSILRIIPIRVSARMTRAAGSARFRGGKPFEIVLSLPYFADGSNDLRETVTHEAAHVVAGLAAKHGPAWKAAHRSMGGKANRCHTMTLSEGFTARRTTERKQVPCSCGCGKPMNLGPTQARRAARGTRYFLKGHAGPRPQGDGLDSLRKMLF